MLLFRPQGLFGDRGMKDALAAIALFVAGGRRGCRCGSIRACALNFIMMALYATLLAQAWNMLGGFGGQFSFGHALFFGTGAYVQAMAQLQRRHQCLGWRCCWPSARRRLVGAVVGALASATG